MTIDKQQESLLVKLAARFDPRIVYPDNLAASAFWALCREWGVLEVQLRTIRRRAGWLPEHWPTST